MRGHGSEKVGGAWWKPRRHGGNALVDFAMVVAPFLLVFFGIIDFARLVATTNALHNAAYEGARLGALLPVENATQRAAAEAAVRSRVANDAIVLGPAIDPTNDVQVTWLPTASDPTSVRVFVQYEFSPLGLMAPIIAAAYPDGKIPLSAQTEVRRELP